MGDEMTMIRDESDGIVSQPAHCMQKKWTMRLEKTNKGEIIMGWLE